MMKRTGIDVRQDGRANSDRIMVLARAGIAGTISFAASVILMHVIQPDLSPVHEAVSYYMNGSFGWVLGFGLVSLGVGSLCLNFAIRREGATGSSVGWWCFALWGAGAIIGGIFSPDPRGHWDQPPSVGGMIHAGVAMIAFLAFPIAALLLSRKLGQHSRSAQVEAWLRRFAIASCLMLLIFFASLAPVFAHRAPFLLGLTERVLLVAYLAWIATAATGIISAPGRHKERQMSQSRTIEVIHPWDPD